MEAEIGMGTEACCADIEDAELRCESGNGGRREGVKRRENENSPWGTARRPRRARSCPSSTAKRASGEAGHRRQLSCTVISHPPRRNRMKEGGRRGAGYGGSVEGMGKEGLTRSAEVMHRGSSMPMSHWWRAATVKVASRCSLGKHVSSKSPIAPPASSNIQAVVGVKLAR